MASYSSKKAITLPLFDGKDESFMVWWMQLCAYLKLYKFAQALGDALEANMPANHTSIVDQTMPQGQCQAAAQ